MSANVDKVPVVCPQCNKRLLVPAGTLGKQGRCPACQTVFTLEQLWEAESIPAAPPPAPYAAPTAFAPPVNQWGQPDPAAANPWNNAPATPANPWAGPAQPAQSSSPFSDDDFKGDYQLQAAPPAPPPNPYSSPQFTSLPASGYSGSYQRKKEGGFWNGSVLGGVAMMVIAVVWFFGGLAVGFIFFYPPILFIIGLVAFFKGLFAGNLAGD